MDQIFHRFRTTRALLEGYCELENQEIYFASPEELNDPMEGYKDIYWRADSIVWKNFIKHYILCLEQICLLFSLGEVRLDRKNISVFRTQEDFPTAKYKELFNEICSNVFANTLLNEYIEHFSQAPVQIRRNELLIYIKSIHFFVLDTIFTIYEKHNLIAKRNNVDYFREKSEEYLSSMRIFCDLNKTKNEHMNIEQQIDSLFFDMANKFAQVNLSQYRESVSSKEKNQFFLFWNYPEVYIQEIESLVYPKWYAACFMTDYTNSSVWAHYGDQHKGVCLSFKSKSENDKKFINLNGIIGIGASGRIFGEIRHLFHKIDYEKKYIEIDFFRTLGCLTHPILLKYWYINEDGCKSVCSEDIFDNEGQWREKYWKNFYDLITKKLKDWDYEHEYRLIISPMMSDFSNKESRKLKYDFTDLVSITFGVRTSIEDKLKIIEIIESKCKKEGRNDFEFYQAYYSVQNGSMDRFLIKLGERTRSL